MFALILLFHDFRHNFIPDRRRVILASHSSAESVPWKGRQSSAIDQLNQNEVGASPQLCDFGDCLSPRVLKSQEDEIGNIHPHISQGISVMGRLIITCSPSCDLAQRAASGIPRIHQVYPSCSKVLSGHNPITPCIPLHHEPPKHYRVPNQRTQMRRSD